MIREPWFWRQRTPLARAAATALWPASKVYDAAQQLRARIATPYQPTTPVVCIGNATLGGSGKTPCAMLIHELLADAGVEAYFQTRGYGGAETGPSLVDLAKHSSHDVGDEALLLAKHAPVWVAKDRAAGVRAAVEAGAGVVIMDDGYQNPMVAKTLNILLIDNGSAKENDKIFPAGPWREPLARAADRADIIMLFGDRPKDTKVATGLPQDKSTFNVWLSPHVAPPAQRVIAFCGIGRPQNFFALAKSMGFDLAGEFSFPDHYVFSEHELLRLTKLAKKENAALMTTAKDHVRLPNEFQQDCLTLNVKMEVDDPRRLAALLLEAVDALVGAG